MRISLKYLLGWHRCHLGLLLMLVGFSVATAQNEPATERQPKRQQSESCGSRVKQRITTWQLGKPWKAPKEGSMRMNHHKILLSGGQMGLLDEYLSPIAHKGMTFGLQVVSDFMPWGKASHSEDAGASRLGHIYQEILLQAGLPKNRANGSQIQMLRGEWSIGSAWRLLRYRHFALDLAPLLNAQLQGEMKPSNSNNYANVKASVGLDAWARVRYQLPSRVFPLGVSYSAQLALLHATFHPGYGQSYFEYISGDERMALRFHPTFVGRDVTLRQRLLVDLPIRHCTFTIGAEYHYQSQTLSHTSFRQAHWGIVLGISFDSLVLSGQRSLSSPHITNSLYQNQ